MNLPFVSIAVSPKDRERQVARRIVLRLRDRRVLSAWECCDDCIENALASLNEIRQLIVDKEVELADLQDGPLFLLLDAMAAGIRQFMTYEELLRRADDAPPHPRFADFHRPEDVRQGYFDGLEILRGHLSRCLGQIAVIAGMPVPSDGIIASYQGAWQLDAYEQPPQLMAPPAHDPAVTVITENPARLSPSEKEAFAAFVAAAGEVNPDTLPGLVDRAAALVMLRQGDTIIGTAAIKTPFTAHRRGEFEKATVSQQADAFPLELGWIVVHPDHRRQGHARTLVAAAVEAVPTSGLYATTKTDQMQPILEENGFIVQGEPYQSLLNPAVMLTLYGRSPTTYAGGGQ
ncbi:GNAT superfamily N-acetyltransferase [Sphingobium sp. B2D3A]|uniref:GNAT family N-acetyltransferase n=1 Tax=unclassified Sphingobium TaxID=2611147 RepID=UPI002224ACC1|nr:MULTISPECIES: GNAT family N-acetyltransferase [unclassified Sphingobium]MCW2337494.1 GNAT superfamily N-acetyltransferase [Sphingobium sp. B2D3A]MCW2383952.1 GNAT superfamily N-acetyltransferase [Sphingobium sp. B2D3D]